MSFIAWKGTLILHYYPASFGCDGSLCAVTYSTSCANGRVPMFVTQEDSESGSYRISKNYVRNTQIRGSK